MEDINESYKVGNQGARKFLQINDWLQPHWLKIAILHSAALNISSGTTRPLKDNPQVFQVETFSFKTWITVLAGGDQ